MFNQTFRVTTGKRELIRTPFGVRETFTPLESHWRQATCEEVQCPAYHHGWVTTLDLDPSQPPDELLANQQRDYYIRQNSGRKFRAELDGSQIHYHFEAGQTCFGASHHKLPLEREPIYLHLQGRGKPVRRLEGNQYFDLVNETSYQLNRRIHG